MARESIALARLGEQKTTLDGLAILRETHFHPLELGKVPELAHLVAKYLSSPQPESSRIIPKLFSSQASLTLRSALWAAVGWLPLVRLTPDILGYHEPGRYSLVVAGPEKGKFGKPWDRVGFFPLYVEEQGTRGGVLVVPPTVWRMAEELVERGLPPLLPHYAWDSYSVYNLDWEAPCIGYQHERFLAGVSSREAKVVGGLLSGWYPDTPGRTGIYPHTLPPQWVEKLVAVGKELVQVDLPVAYQGAAGWKWRRDIGLLYARRIPFVLETREKHFEYRRITNLQTTSTGSLVSIEVTSCDSQGEAKGGEAPASYALPSSPPGCDHSGVSVEDLHFCEECDREICEDCGYVCEECENWVCEDHRGECDGCGVTLCSQCSCSTCFECEGCGHIHPEEDRRQCDGCERSPLCPTCAAECCPYCKGCGEQTSKENLGSCSHCGVEGLCEACRESCPCQD